MGRSVRSRNMAAIRGKDTAPELAVRRILHAMGLRFRLHRKDLPGRFTTVQADVETADGGIRHLKIVPPLLEEFSDGIPLRLMKLHSISHMPAGNYQAVAFGDGVGISNADRQFVPEQHPI